MEREGADFYSRVSRIAADPRARKLFHDLADGRLEAASLLITRYGELSDEDHDLEAEDANRRLEEKGLTRPSIYPHKSVETAVCFVCGEEVLVDDLPPECPFCGASGYSFESDIDEGQAFAMVRENESKRLDFYRQSMQAASGDARALLATLIQQGEECLRDLEAEGP